MSQEKEEKTKAATFAESKVEAIKLIGESESFALVSVQKEDESHTGTICLALNAESDMIISLHKACLKMMDEFRDNMLEQTMKGMPDGLRKVMEGLKEMAEKASKSEES